MTDVKNNFLVVHKIIIYILQSSGMSLCAMCCYLLGDDELQKVQGHPHGTAN